MTADYPITRFFNAPNPDKQGYHKICYYEWGAENRDKKPVVCVHGLTRNARDFDFLAYKLAEDGYRVIAIDVAGRGKSEWLPNKKWYEYKNYADDIIRLLKSIDITSCYWVGTSMGGIIAMAVNAFAPTLIEKVVLNDIGYEIPKDAMNRLASYVGNQIHFVNFEEYNRALTKILVGFGITDSTHWAHTLNYSAKRNEDGSYDLLYDPTINHIFRDDEGNPKQLDTVDLTFLWKKITCDEMLIRGSKSDLVSHEMAMEMKRRKKNLVIAEIEDVGHAPALMEPDQIKIVIDFLNSPHHPKTVIDKMIKSRNTIIAKIFNYFRGGV